MRIPKGGIAFFDSGIGGLTVLNECIKLLPDEIFYYYGDNAHAPYGNLQAEEILRLTRRAFRCFQRRKVKAAVIACNTATAVCVERLRKEFPFPIIGAEPAVALAAPSGGEVLVLTTKATYESVRFQRLCMQVNERFPAAVIHPVPCERLAGEIEKNLSNPNADFSPFLPLAKPASVVLGCTHYVYVAEQISRFYGCDVFDGNRGIAERLKRVIEGVKQEDRERRPLFGIFAPKRKNFAQSQEGKKGKNLPSRSRKCEKRKNKRSCLFLKKSQKSTKNTAKIHIFYLGSQKKRNKIIYEQMFACAKEG